MSKHCKIYHTYTYFYVLDVKPPYEIQQYKQKEGIIIFNMKEEFFTGIEFIDQEHAKLFEIANRLYEISHDDFIPDKYDYIVEVIKELTEYTKYHFDHEEEFMKSVNHKKMFSQIVSHNDFIDYLEAIDLESADLAQEETIMNLLNFLYDWLVNHICKSDMQIADELRSEGKL